MQVGLFLSALGAFHSVQGQRVNRLCKMLPVHTGRGLFQNVQAQLLIINFTCGISKLMFASRQLWLDAHIAGKTDG